jgi:hypothetical protein
MCFLLSSSHDRWFTRRSRVGYTSACGSKKTCRREAPAASGHSPSAGQPAAPSASRAEALAGAPGGAGPLELQVHRTHRARQGGPGRRRARQARPRDGDSSRRSLRHHHARRFGRAASLAHGRRRVVICSSRAHDRDDPHRIAPAVDPSDPSAPQTATLTLRSPLGSRPFDRDDDDNIDRWCCQFA